MKFIPKHQSGNWLQKINKRTQQVFSDFNKKSSKVKKIQLDIPQYNRNETVGANQEKFVKYQQEVRRRQLQKEAEEVAAQSEKGLSPIFEDGKIVGYAPYRLALSANDKPLSGADPMASFIVEGVALGPVFKLAGRGLQWGLAMTGNSAARRAIIAREFQRAANGLDGTKPMQVLKSGLIYEGEKPRTSLVIKPTSPPSIPNKTYLKLVERPNKLTVVERKGILKGQARIENDPEVFENAKAFAKKYGYEEPTTVEEIKNMYRRHNRFFRTVSPLHVGKYDMERGVHYGIDTKRFPQLFGVTEQELPSLLASKGYPYEQYLNHPEFDLYPTEVFVSPTFSENAIYHEGDLTKTILLQRPFSFRNPKNWHIDAEYKVPSSEQAVGKGEISWGNGSPLHEFKVSTKHLIPVREARSSDLGTNMGNIFDRLYGEQNYRFF